jgi:transcriptional regulator with XRE-family HTH domain
MRAAARDGGLSVEEIARRLGVGPQTVDRWWTDQRIPEGDWLRRYTALVRRPVSYFYAEDRLTELAGFLEEFADPVMGDEEPPAAWDQLTGRPDAFSPAARAELTGRAAAPRISRQCRTERGVAL